MFIDPFSIIGTDLASALVKEWVRLRQSKKADELATAEWQQLEKEYMEHLRWRFQYPKQVFGQQLIYSWLLTILVIGLVVCGLVFSFIQLEAAIELGDLSSLTTELEVQTAGKLSMSSSIVGAVVLVISLVFFNLYLKNVFRIQHPVPPHIALSETDAAGLWRQSPERSHTMKSGEELDNVDPKKDKDK